MKPSKGRLLTSTTVIWVGCFSCSSGRASEGMASSAGAGMGNNPGRGKPGMLLNIVEVMRLGSGAVKSLERGPFDLIFTSGRFEYMILSVQQS